MNIFIKEINGKKTRLTLEIVLRESHEPFINAGKQLGIYLTS